MGVNTEQDVSGLPRRSSGGCRAGVRSAGAMGIVVLLAGVLLPLDGAGDSEFDSARPRTASEAGPATVGGSRTPLAALWPFRRSPVRMPALSREVARVADGSGNTGGLIQAAAAAWGRVGCACAATGTVTVVNATSLGAVGDGRADDSGAIAAAIENATGPTVVRLPAGTYRLGRSLFLKSGLVLRGDGASQTHLVFEGTNTGGRCIGIARWDSDQNCPRAALAAGVQQGSRQVRLAAVPDFAPGDIVEIEQENDPAWKLNEAWQQTVEGQIVRVSGVDARGGLLQLDRPLRTSFIMERRPTLRKLVVIQDAGVEDLSVRKADEVEGYSIELKHAVRCWVRGVESEMTFKGHVNLERCFEAEVRDSCFSGSYRFGGGGQGYGVVCGRHTSDCLVENNVFSTLRHSLIVGSGANGNVFGYNFSTARAGRSQWGDLIGDLSVHGNYVFLNLFEGNVVDEAGVPDWYYPAGPENTLYRNRIAGKGLAVDVASDQQIICGNELATGGVLRVRSGVRGTISCANTPEGGLPARRTTLPASLYRINRPSFLSDADPETSWPCIGPGRASSAGKIPAEHRFTAGRCIPESARN